MSSSIEFILNTLNRNLEQIKKYLVDVTLEQQDFVNKKIKIYNEIPKQSRILVTQLKKLTQRSSRESKEENFATNEQQENKHASENYSQSQEDQTLSKAPNAENSVALDLKVESGLMADIVDVENLEKLCKVLFDNISHLQNCLSELMQETGGIFEVELLGLRDKQVINQIVDFIIVFGLAPKLLSGTTLPIEKRLESSKLEKLGFKAHIFNKYNEITRRIYSNSDEHAERRAELLSLIEWTEKFGTLVTSQEYTISDVGSITRSRALVDIISAFLQTAYSPEVSKFQNFVSSDRIIGLRKTFTKIFNSKANRQLILESLFALMNFSRGAKRWFSVLVSRFLSRLLVFDNGVSLLFGFVVGSDSTDRALTTPKLEGLYKLITTTPSYINEGEYYTNILGQLCETIRVADHSLSMATINTSALELTKESRKQAAQEYEYFINNINQISIYIFSRLYAEKNETFVKTALPMLVGPLLLCEDKRLYAFNDINSLSFLETKAESLDLQALIDNAVAYKSQPNSKEPYKPLIKILDDSENQKSLHQKLTNNLPPNISTAINDQDLLKAKILKIISPTIQVYSGDDNEMITGSENEILVEFNELDQVLNRLVALSSSRFADNSDFGTFVLNQVFTPLLHWYQFLLDVKSSLDDEETASSEIKIEKSNDKNINRSISVISNTIEKLEIIISQYFRMSPISEITTAFKKVILSDRLSNVIQSQTPTSGMMYPLFAIGKNAKTCIVYPKKYPYTILHDVLLKEDLGLQKGGTTSSEADDDRLKNISALYQSKFQVSSLSSLVEKQQENTYLHDLAASIFINLLNEYSALSDQINNLELQMPEEESRKVRVIDVQTPFTRDIKKDTDSGNSTLSQKYTLLSQTLLEFVFIFGPQVLSKISHILAFIDTILTKTIESPPLSIDNNNIDRLNSELYLKLEIGNEQDREGSYQNEQLESQLDSSEQLILALNLLVAACASNLESSLGGKSSSESPDEQKTAETLYKSIFKKLGALKTQWREYPLIIQLIDQAVELSTMSQPHLSKIAGLQSGFDIQQETQDPTSADDIYHTALMDLQNPLVPIQAFGLSKLQDLLIPKGSNISGLLAKSQITGIIETIVELIKHEDSFIYLKAIQVLSRASKSSAILEDLLPILVERYSNRNNGLDFRLRVSETFSGIIGNYGQVMVRYTDTLLPMFCRTIDYRQNEDPDLVHSALSVLGLYCEINPLVLKNYLEDISEFCKNACLSRGYNQTVKRASLVLLLSIISGYSKNADLAKSINVSVLRDIYKVLKTIADSNSSSLDNKDELLEYNANIGLQELNSLIRSLF